MNIKKVLRNALITIALVSPAVAEASGFEYDSRIKPDERDFSLSKSYLFEDGQLYKGADFGVSNLEKKFWLFAGFYEGEHSNVRAVFKASTVPLEYCFALCENRFARTSLELRFGTGVYMEVSKTSTPFKVMGSVTDFVQFSPIDVPHYDVKTGLVGDVEMVGRFGVVEAKYALSSSKDSLMHKVDVGVRF